MCGGRIGNSIKSAVKSAANAASLKPTKQKPTSRSGGSRGGAFGKAGKSVFQTLKKGGMTRGIQGEPESEAQLKPSERPVTGLIGDSMKGKSFDKINAEITRRKWDQFEKNDKPYILNYADEITSGKYVDRATAQAVQGVNQGFAQAANTQAMRDSSMGLGLSSAQLNDRRSDMARNKTASLIDAENNARTAATDRENALLAGSHMPKTGN